MAHLGKRQRSCRRGEAIGIAKRVSYGEVHVGHSELGLYGAVDKLHHGMDDALRMNHYANIFRSASEEPAGFYHFESLVHH